MAKIGIFDRPIITIEHVPGDKVAGDKAALEAHGYTVSVIAEFTAGQPTGLFTVIGTKV